MLTEEEKKARKRAQQKQYREANREKINARKRAYVAKRYATDPEFKERMKEHGRKYRESLSTGYGRGRPRLDEVRPVSKLAECAKRYRKDNAQWAEYNRKKQAEWAAANPERVKEIKRAWYERQKARSQNQ